MNERRLLVLGMVFMLLGAVGRPAVAATVVIANDEVSAQEIDKRDLQKVFLGRTSEFGGKRVVLATLRDGARHKAFTDSYLQMTPQQFTNHWRKIVFSGTGKEPHSFESEVELVSFVSRTPGAIGYISSQTAHSGVKTLNVK
jgi:ABC-type phosphate transport system substrate-binding protein